MVAFKLPNHIYNGSLGEGFHCDKKKMMNHEDRMDTVGLISAPGIDWRESHLSIDLSSDGKKDAYL